MANGGADAPPAGGTGELGTPTGQASAVERGNHSFLILEHLEMSWKFTSRTEREALKAALKYS